MVLSPENGNGSDAPIAPARASKKITLGKFGVLWYYVGLTWEEIHMKYVGILVAVLSIGALVSPAYADKGGVPNENANENAGKGNNNAGGNGKGNAGGNGGGKGVGHGDGDENHDGKHGKWN